MISDYTFSGRFTFNSTKDDVQSRMYLNTNTSYVHKKISSVTTKKETKMYTKYYNNEEHHQSTKTVGYKIKATQTRTMQKNTRYSYKVIDKYDFTQLCKAILQQQQRQSINPENLEHLY